MLLKLGCLMDNLLLLQLLRRRLLLLQLLSRRQLLGRRQLLAEVSRCLAGAPRGLMEVGRRLGTGAPVSRVVMVMLLVVVIMLRGLLDVEVGVPQLSVLPDQVLHLSLEFVDALALRLDQTLLVLDDGGEFLQVQNSFHWIIQQALHY